MGSSSGELERNISMHVEDWSGSPPVLFKQNIMSVQMEWASVRSGNG